MNPPELFPDLPPSEDPSARLIRARNGVAAAETAFEWALTEDIDDLELYRQACAEASAELQAAEREAMERLTNPHHE